MADSCWNEEVWLLLPWLANGRLSHPDCARVEAHVRECALCTREVALQRVMCDVLTEPERVTYAPGPSFRKLLDRIDGRSAAPREDPRASEVRAFPAPGRAAWRPPGLAWAASFLLVVGLAGVAATTYRWSQPLYATHTAPGRPTPEVLHIAFVPSLSVGEAGTLLRAAGARVVEGPNASGIFGVAPVSSAPGTPQAEASVQLRTLASRLRADARVRWVQPLAVDAPER
jgi:hypothetical protein